MHILLVEDCKTTAEALRLLLQREGFFVTAAATREEAKALCARHRFSLLLCDISLPDGESWGLLRELREACIDAPAVAVSGSDTPKDRRRSLEAGFAAHVCKPVNPEGLVSIIRWVSGARERVANE